MQHTGYFHNNMRFCTQCTLLLIYNKIMEWLQVGVNIAVKSQVIATSQSGMFHEYSLMIVMGVSLCIVLVCSLDTFVIVV